MIHVWINECSWYDCTSVVAVFGPSVGGSWGVPYIVVGQLPSFGRRVQYPMPINSRRVSFHLSCLGPFFSSDPCSALRRADQDMPSVISGCAILVDGTSQHASVLWVFQHWAFNMAKKEEASQSLPEYSKRATGVCLAQPARDVLKCVDGCTVTTEQKFPGGSPVRDTSGGTAEVSSAGGVGVGVGQDTAQHVQRLVRSNDGCGLAGPRQAQYRWGRDKPIQEEEADHPSNSRHGDE